LFLALHAAIVHAQEREMSANGIETEVKRALDKKNYGYIDHMLMAYVQWWRLALIEGQQGLAERAHKIIRTILDRRYQRTHYIPDGNRVYWAGTNVPISIAGMAILRRIHIRRSAK
jgi:hypothetical protein